MGNYIYNEISIFCVIVLLIILFRIPRSISVIKHPRSFRIVVMADLVYVIIGMFWGITDGNALLLPNYVSYLINTLMLFSTAIASYAWFVYSETCQNSALMKNKFLKWLTALPLIIEAYLLVISHKTGWIFLINENGFYERGIYLHLHLLITFGYLFFTAIKALIKSYEKRNIVNKSSYKILAYYIIPPIIASMLEIKIPGSAYLCVGITLSLLIVFINFQEELISIDPLTHLNNRHHLLKYINNKINGNDKQELYVLMIDVDDFKIINDVYGHIEGDKALIAIAEGLKNACSKESCMVARYGGDEFIIAGTFEDNNYLTGLSKQIEKEIEQATINNKLKCEIKVSIGIKKYTNEVKNATDLIESADEKLYSVKKKRKNKKK